MVKPIWKLRTNENPEAIQNLREAINCSETLASLLLQRGINTYESAKQFFNPNLDELHNPMLMKDMDKAVDRLNSALQNQEKILVFGDYDVDGTTAVAMMYGYLSGIQANCAYYIPDRYTEGYGISNQGIEYAKEHNFTLIIALDCGIQAHDKVDYAKELGIDFIICDHHLPSDTIPSAVAVLDPKRSDCSYPFKELCGCGVGFKLIQAHSKNHPKIYQHLDLLAISICADIVSLTDENRVLCYFGLQVMNTEKLRPGIDLLLRQSVKKKKLNVRDLVFTIAPRINAAGRISKGSTAVSLLLSQTETEAEPIANSIGQFNNDRKGLDKQITLEALELLAQDKGVNERKSTVVFSTNWHKGVVGIVASRLIENYYRPTIVLTESNGLATGSARSVEGFDVHAAINSCKDLLVTFGGHKAAAGLSLAIDHIPEFTKRFEQAVAANITPQQMQPTLYLDTKLDFPQINQGFLNTLKRMAPHGPDNMSPVFYSENVIDTGYAKIVGDTHLKCTFTQTHNREFSFAAIAFGKAEYLPLLQSKKPLKIAFELSENEYNGNSTIQLEIKDIALLEA